MPTNTNIGKRRQSNADTSSAFYQEKRKAIVDAAAEAFLERGYDATNFGVIAEQLNTDRASLYYYFGSKQELFREIVREAAQNTVSTAESIAAQDAPADDKLRKAFEAVMESYRISFPYMHVFLQEKFPTIANKNDPWNEENQEWARRYYLAIRQIIQQGVDEGTFDLPLPVGVTTMGVLGTVNWAHRWYKPKSGSLEPAEIGAGFADMILNGLCAPAAERKTAKKPEADPS